MFISFLITVTEHLARSNLRKDSLPEATVQENQEPREVWCWAQLLSMKVEGCLLTPR